MKIRIAGLLAVAALGAASGGGTSAGVSDLTARRGTFQAQWNVSGTVHVMEFVEGAMVAAGHLEGNILVEVDKGPFNDFRTECVVFSEEQKHGVGRCVWEGPLGDLAYVELKSSGMSAFGAVQGRFVGGTGKLEGLKGSFSFEWNYSLSGDKDATLNGYSIQMMGNYDLPD
ncbi:MAG: hypothetical protein ACREAA_15685 [Candidatus Polarisedimenticolia bacterium]